MIHLLCEKIAAITNKASGRLKALITFVKDRPGHDQRYAIDCARIKRELGWPGASDFSERLDLTLLWYMDNPDWIRRVRTGAYRDWLERNYGSR